MGVLVAELGGEDRHHVNGVWGKIVVVKTDPGYSPTGTPGYRQNRRDVLPVVRAERAGSPAPSAQWLSLGLITEG